MRSALDLLSEVVADQRHELLRVANTGVCRFRYRFCAPAITVFSMALCSATVNALRIRFDRAFRAAFGH